MNMRERRPNSHEIRNHSLDKALGINFLGSFSREKPLYLKKFLTTLEQSIILHVLDQVHGNQREAAKVLGIKYTTLNEKVKKYRIHFKKKPIRDSAKEDYYYWQ